MQKSSPFFKSLFRLFSKTLYIPDNDLKSWFTNGNLIYLGMPRHDCMKTVFDFVREVVEEQEIEQFMAHLSADSVLEEVEKIVTELNSCGMEFSKNEQVIMEGWV